MVQVEDAEKYKCNIDDSPNLRDINYPFFQLRMRLQLLVSPQRMASNLTYIYNLRKLPSPTRKLAINLMLLTVQFGNETIKCQWFDASQEDLEEEYKEKQKELEAIAK
jgi:hypothetical protein